MTTLATIKTPFSVRDQHTVILPYECSCPPRRARLSHNQYNALVDMVSRAGGWHPSMLQSKWYNSTLNSIENAIFRHNAGRCFEDCPVPDNQVVVAAPIGPKGGQRWVAVTPDEILQKCASISEELYVFAEKWLYIVINGSTKMAIFYASHYTIKTPNRELPKWTDRADEIKSEFVKVLREHYWNS